jgi:ribose transport system substrate-binding protein
MTLRERSWLALGVLAVSVAAAIVSAGGSGAAGATGGASTSPTRVAFLIATTSAGFPRGVLNAAKAEAKKHNVAITVFDAQFNPQKQFAQCQDAIARRTFQAIVVLPAASPAMVPCARLAQQAKIPLISTDTPVGSNLRTGKPTVPGVTAQVLVPAITAFASLKNSVLSACRKQGGGDKCRVGFIMGVKALALTTPASELLQSWVKQAGGVYVGEAEGFYQRGGGLKVMQDLLQKDPKLNVLVSMSDDMALGAEVAMKSAGKQPGRDILVLTQGGSYPGVQRLRAGAWYATSVVNAQAEGAVPIRLAAQAVAGKKIPSYVNSTKAGGTPQIINQAVLEKLRWFKGTFPA